MIKNSKFLDTFPKLEYDINNTNTITQGPHETVTDIFFRFGIVKSIVSNASAYYVYDVQESDTPELLAEQIYNDSGAAWIIIYANKIIDPLFDWPLNYDAFQKMIKDKYGSVENAQTTTHHCEKVVTRVNEFFGTTSVTRFVVDQTRQTLQPLHVPYNYYTPYTATTYRTADSGVFTADDYEIPYATADMMYDDLQVVSKSGSVAYSNEVNTYNIDGKTVVETIQGVAVSNYDYELRLNDDKKVIKIIKREFYTPIMNEFKTITGTIPAYLRM